MNTEEKTLEKNLKDMSTVLKLQRRVAEMASENKEKVTTLQAKFEKIQQEAFDECPVCYNDISVRNTCCMPNCDHKMCKNCYYNWLDKQEKNTCPMCREEVFKNNLDIKTKRSTLLRHLDTLESEVSDMYHERRTIRHSLDSEKNDLRAAEYDLMKINMKFNQLEDEIWDKQQILDEIHEYKRHPDKWLKKKEKRLKKEITKGNKIWREHMKTIINEVMDEYRLKCIINEQKGGYISFYYREELKRLRESPVHSKVRPIEDCGWIDYIYHDKNPVDLATTNMFYVDETGYTTPPGLEDRNIYSNMPELIAASDTDSDLEEGEISEPPNVRRQLNFNHINSITNSREHAYMLSYGFNNDEDRSTGEVTTSAARI